MDSKTKSSLPENDHGWDVLVIKYFAELAPRAQGRHDIYDCVEFLLDQYELRYVKGAKAIIEPACECSLKRHIDADRLAYRRIGRSFVSLTPAGQKWSANCNGTERNGTENNEISA